MKIIKSALFVAAMFTLAFSCQSKKTESEQTAQDTATVVESETIVSGDSMEVITDSAKIVMPDSIKK
ncbi:MULTISPECIES: hypothetical protein [Spirosoma]|uniref:Uncharacterized protein n=1 Tax=Spirosoma liriopis TaxID=2937440 RepID=A0ABT0HRR8_9BACT|nr:MULTISPECIES: hypothetical protein [Spirosoma]MCK8494832.1 hypothetical protein [Spirosoma liriopis]UHG93961.1 hypothetical protein LQ777_24660 [Spirosoma oryzicola]